MDSKSGPPPTYMAAPPQMPPPAGGPQYPPQNQQQYGSPPGAPPMQPQPEGYFQPQVQTQYQGPVGGVGAVGGVSGYSTGGTPQMNINAGAQYQQQLFALCAQGNHDVTTKYGVGGIIVAIVCFPCGLLALLCDVEKRCVRCGQRVA